MLAFLLMFCCCTSNALLVHKAAADIRLNSTAYNDILYKYSDHHRRRTQHPQRWKFKHAIELITQALTK